MNSRVGKEAINTFLGGMNTDLDKSLLKNNQYRYAKNLRVVQDSLGSFGALTPIEDTKIKSNLVFNGMTVIATAKIRSISVVFLKDSLGTYVYKVENINDNIVTTLTHSMDFICPDNISIVTRHEDDDNIKVYWSDGVNQIRCINIANATSNISDRKNPDIYNIIPDSNLSKPIIRSINTGNLKSGRIQYYYQLYTNTGTSSVLSTPSNVVDIKLSDTEGGIIDTLYGEPAGKSIKIKIDISNAYNFYGVRIYSVYYYNYSASPVITLIGDIKIKDESGVSLITGNYLYYTDSGSSSLSEYTVDEFNLISSNKFSAGSIESKDDILFASNIKENQSFDVDYDTRSFQFNNTPIFTYSGVRSTSNSIIVMGGAVGTVPMDYLFSIGNSLIYCNGSIIPLGNIKITSIDNELHKIVFDNDISTYMPLTMPYTIEIGTSEYSATYKTRIYSNDGSYNEYTNKQLHIIPSTHDCIHKEIYEENKFSDLSYVYNGNSKLGGTGLNVDFLFTNTYLIGARAGDRTNRGLIGSSSETYQNEYDRYIDIRTPIVGDWDRNVNSFKMSTSDGVSSNVSSEDIGFSGHTGLYSYENPLISGSLQGYKRDEIYRFGCIFVDNKGNETDVKWIADIRFPASYIKTIDFNASSFESPYQTETVFSGENSFLENQELLVKPMGLKFIFRNLSEIDNLSKIKIVRSKRDINNRTIFSQGLLNKIGTYKKITDDPSKDDFNDINGYDTLRPHPIAAMGYSYGIQSPVIGNSSKLIAATGQMYPEDGPGMGYDILYDRIPLDVTDSIYTLPDLLQAPYFYNRDYIMFISPEVSYYGNEFVEQLRHACKNPVLSFLDLVMPITAPAVTNMNDTSGAIKSYVGRYEHGYLRFTNRGVIYPTAIYIAAGLNKDLIASFSDSGHLYGPSNLMHTQGLAGIDSLAIMGLSSNYLAWKDNISSSMYDIYPERNDYINSIPVFVSSTGVSFLNTSLDYTKIRYANCVDGDIVHNTSSDNMKPYTMSDRNAIRYGYGSSTYKFYTSFNKNLNNTYGGNSISISYQTGDKITEKTTSTVTSVGGISVCNIFDYEFAESITDPIAHKNISEYTLIGGMLFANYSRSLSLIGKLYATDAQNTTYETIERTKVYGPHGRGIVMSVDSAKMPSVMSVDYKRKAYYLNRFYSTMENLDKAVSSATSNFIVDIKKMNSGIYGGNSYQDRQFSEYIYTGFDISVDNGYGYVFGGDTFVSMFDYTITHAQDPMVEDYQSNDDKKNWWNNSLLSGVARIGLLAAIETSINTFSDGSGTYSRNGNKLLTNRLSGSYGPAVSAGNTWTQSQQKDEHEYNSSYSSEQTAKGYISKIFSSEDNNTYDCRIMASEKKTNDEIIDSWSNFKVSNYIDVDTRYGEITRIKEYADKLFYFQENAVGIVSVNDRAVISDTNGSQLSLGVGGILQRYDYIDKSVGLSKYTVLGMNSTATGIYWYDAKRNIICRANQKGVEYLSKTKGVQSDLNFNKNKFASKIPIGVNSKYNEVLITFNGLSPYDNTGIDIPEIIEEEI